MQLCQKHWEMLKKAIDDHGLTHLIPKDGEQAIERLKNNEYDPLMSANYMIGINALKHISQERLNGTCCPICEVIKIFKGKKNAQGHVLTKQELEEEWTTGPAQGQFEYCIQEGIIIIH